MAAGDLTSWRPYLLQPITPLPVSFEECQITTRVTGLLSLCWCMIQDGSSAPIVAGARHKRGQKRAEGGGAQWMQQTRFRHLASS